MIQLDLMNQAKAKLKLAEKEAAYLASLPTPEELLEDDMDED